MGRQTSPTALEITCPARGSPGGHPQTKALTGSPVAILIREVSRNLSVSKHMSYDTHRL